MINAEKGQPGRRFGWGLVGTGNHSARYIGPALVKSEVSELVAVCSRETERAKEFSESLGGSARPYDDLDAMLKDEAVDGVFISSPNHTHREQVIKAAEAGKDVLCEKPLSTNPEDSLAMIRVCSKEGVKLGVGFNQRFNPVHEEARRLVTSGQVGEILFTEVEYMSLSRGRGTRKAWRDNLKTAGGGDFMGSGIHSVDLVRFMTGQEIDSIFARVSVEDSMGIDRLVHATLQLEGGRYATLSAGSVVPFPSNGLAVYGTKGTVRCLNSIGNLGGGEVQVTTAEGGVKKVSYEKCDDYLREIDAFVRAVSAGGEPSATGVDGLRVDEVTSALYQSTKSGMITPIARSVP